MRAVTALTSITSVGSAVAAAQGAQRLGEPRGAQGGASNLLGVLNARAGRVQARDQELGVSGDRRQEIVEVVRDVTGQPAARLHFPGQLDAVARASPRWRGARLVRRESAASPRTPPRSR